jgi:hypothetical protein
LPALPNLPELDDTAFAAGLFGTSGITAVSCPAELDGATGLPSVPC